LRRRRPELARAKTQFRSVRRRQNDARSGGQRLQRRRTQREAARKAALVLREQRAVLACIVLGLTVAPKAGQDRRAAGHGHVHGGAKRQHVDDDRRVHDRRERLDAPAPPFEAHVVPRLLKNHAGESSVPGQGSLA
jgi:hypothetical protein